MSRNGKKPIQITKNVTVTKDNDIVTVKGPKGELSLKIVCSDLVFEINENSIQIVNNNANDKVAKSFFGTYRSLLANMVEGVSNGFTKNLEMIGVGFRAALKGNSLELLAGFSNPVLIDIPSDIKVELEANTKIKLFSIDNVRLGDFAAKIRAVRPPEPYKGKGIRYEGEYVRKKAGKSGK